MSELRRKNKELENELLLLAEQHEQEVMALQLHIRSMELERAKLTSDDGEASALMLLAAAAGTFKR